MQPSSEGVVSLKGYITFWGWAFTGVTLAIALFKQESDHFIEAAEAQRRAEKDQRQAKGVAVNSHKSDGHSDWQNTRQEIVAAYVQLWDVVRLDIARPSQVVAALYQSLLVASHASPSCSSQHRSASMHAPPQALHISRWSPSHPAYVLFLMRYVFCTHRCASPPSGACHFC